MPIIKLLKDLGYAIQEGVYSKKESDNILMILSNKDFGKRFGVRYFLMDTPELIPFIFTSRLKDLVLSILPNAKLIKSMYFDKPPTANWIVNWHQDLTINVLGKTDEEGYTKWRKTANRIAVQPPLDILENILTIRIHLDDCTIHNGALKVVPKSHALGVVKSNDFTEAMKQTEHVCEVSKGGVLLMKPLIFHASKRVENNQNRRVIHLEFSSKKLAKGLTWLEQIEYVI